MRLRRVRLAEKLRRIAFPDATAILFYGTLPYQPPPLITIKSTDMPVFEHQILPSATGPEGAYLILVLRYSPPSETDYSARVRELTLRSLLGTVLGENIVYKRLFQNAVRLDKPETTAYGQAVRNPGSCPEPDISDERLTRAGDLYAAIDRLEEHERNAVLLSLRWHGDARDAEGSESFVAEWIALEAIGMSDSDYVRPLVEALAQAYGMTASDAKAHFNVGRLFGFRSKIVHRGYIPSIHAALLDYLRAIYKDVLWQRVGFASERAAEAMLARPGFDLLSLLVLDQ